MSSEQKPEILSAIFQSFSRTSSGKTLFIDSHTSEGMAPFKEYSPEKQADTNWLGKLERDLIPRPTETQEIKIDPQTANLLGLSDAIIIVPGSEQPLPEGVTGYIVDRGADGEIAGKASDDNFYIVDAERKISKGTEDAVEALVNTASLVGVSIQIEQEYNLDLVENTVGVVNPGLNSKITTRGAEQVMKGSAGQLLDKLHAE